ncbi:MAG: cytochrome c biogenesis protein CcsA, partial [Chitinophagaceae bacterium]
MKTHYFGEHLLPGYLGHFFVLIAFAASLVATISYYRSTISRDQFQVDSWIKMGRCAFFIQAGAIFCVFGILLFIISHHYFEYQYVWRNSSRA